MTMKHHPIQLQGAYIDHLEVSVLDRHRFHDDDYAKDFKYKIYQTDFDDETSEVSVKVELVIEPGEEKLDRPFSMRIVVVGHFKVDTEKFPVNFIPDWCQNNAPIILLPFIREHAYSLSVRAGFNPIILPLVEVPSFVIEERNSSGKSK